MNIEAPDIDPMNRDQRTPNGCLATALKRLPQPVVDLAIRLGARTDLTEVRLTQHGTMHSGARARRMKFSTQQIIQLRQPAFDWRALTGPLAGSPSSMPCSTEAQRRRSGSWGVFG